MSRPDDDARQKRAFDWVRQLCEESDRTAGSRGERRSAQRIADWLAGLGLPDAELRPFASHPRSGWVLALHAGTALLGLWWGGLIGVLLAGAAAWSLPREQKGPLLSGLLPTPDSLNVVARRGAASPSRRVVLSAHIDTAQAGLLFDPRLADRFARGSRGSSRSGAAPRGPLALPNALLAAAALLALAGWLGAGGVVFLLAKLACGFGLALAVGLGLQWGFAAPTPGANDNASAVAAMLTCAEQLLAGLPDDVELWVVGTGAEEVGCRGMHALLASHPEWESAPTFFLNFECVGGGSLHYIQSEGTLAKTLYPPTLLELARRVAEGGGFGDVTGTQLLAGTDGHVPAGAGYSTLSLISLEANGVPRNYHRPDDVPEALDYEMVVRAADFGAAVIRALWRGEAAPLHRV